MDRFNRGNKRSQRKEEGLRPVKKGYNRQRTIGSVVDCQALLQNPQFPLLLYKSLKKKIQSSTNFLVMLLLLLSRFSRVRLCATPQTAAHQAPPSLGFSRQEHWSGLPFPSPVHESEK